MSVGMILVGIATVVIASLFIRFMGKVFDMTWEAYVGLLALGVFLLGVGMMRA